MTLHGIDLNKFALNSTVLNMDKMIINGNMFMDCYSVIQSVALELFRSTTNSRILKILETTFLARSVRLAAGESDE